MENKNSMYKLKNIIQKYIDGDSDVFISKSIKEDSSFNALDIVKCLNARKEFYLFTIIDKSPVTNKSLLIFKKCICIKTYDINTITMDEFHNRLKNFGFNYFLKKDSDLLLFESFTNFSDLRNYLLNLLGEETFNSFIVKGLLSNNSSNIFSKLANNN